MKMISQKELFDGISSLGSNPIDFMANSNFDILEEYQESEAIKIVLTLSLINTIDFFCHKNNLKHKDYKFIYYKNIPYVNINSLGLELTQYLYFLLYNRGIGIIEIEKSTFISIYNIECLDHLINMPPTIKLEKQQHTYIMFDESTCLYKIGRSCNVSFREKTLQGQIPLIKTILTNENNVEKELHRLFSVKHRRGEWYGLNADDILLIIEKYGFKRYKRS